MAGRVLHVLAQRPSLTGSGVTLDALVRHAARAGWEQRVLCGVPEGGPDPAVGGLPAWSVSTVRFGGERLPFPVPGMSDVMPYASTRFSAMDEGQLAAYRTAWREALRAQGEAFEPDVVHSHHLWLVSALVKDALPRARVVTHCHATGLRQMRLCPALADEVVRGCGRNDHFVVLTAPHAAALVEALSVTEDRVTVVGAGFAESVFHPRGRVEPARPTLLYAGKLARAKGLPWLLDAVERVARARQGLVLDVAGGGGGDEADAIRARMERMGPLVRYRGRVGQEGLAELARASSLLVLPSFYEGLPLVLAEAVGCGCRALATRLPGIEAELAPALGEMLCLVDPPRLDGPDEPVAEDLPRFVEDLARAIDLALDLAPPAAPPPGLSELTWASVFSRVSGVWTGASSG